MGPVTAGSRPSPDVRTTLYLVRHGEADSHLEGRFGGWSPAPLTARGRRQAEAVARALVGRAPTALVSSDLVRARETAAPIAVETGLPLQLDERLRERSVGIFDGLGFREAEERFPEVWRRMLARDPDVVPEGGETVDAVFARVGAALDDVVARHAGGAVVVVTHGIALFHAFAHVCGLGSPRGSQRVFVLADNASVTHLEHRSGEGHVHWRIHTVNDTRHLVDLA
jgi:broad specificity phosphatase PhoE